MEELRREHGPGFLVATTWGDALNGKLKEIMERHPDDFVITSDPVPDYPPDDLDPHTKENPS